MMELGVVFFMFLVFFFKFIYLFFREREHEWGRGKERGREGIPSRLHSLHSVWHRAQSHDCKIMTWAEIKSQILNWLSHPGVPVFLVFKVAWIHLLMFFIKFGNILAIISANNISVLHQLHNIRPTKIVPELINGLIFFFHCFLFVSF